MRTTDFGDDKDRVLVRSNGELTYFASDTAYYVEQARARLRRLHLHARRRPPRVRRSGCKAMAACAGDDPEHNIEVLIGQLVKILKGGEEMRLSKRAGTIVTLRRAGRGVRGRRAAVHAVPLPGGLPADPGHRGDDPPGQRQPGVLRPVRARPARLDAAQRRRARHRSWTSSTRVCSATSGRATCSARWPSSRASSPPPPSCASRTGSRATWRNRAGVPRFYDGCRVLPRGDEEASRLHRARLSLVAATGPCWPTGWICSASPRRSGCEGARGGLRSTATWAGAARRGCARRMTPTPRPLAVVGNRARRTAKASLEVGGVDVRDRSREHGSPAYVLDEDDFRARARAFSDAFEDCRRLLRRQGVPLFDGGPLGDAKRA